VVAPDGTLYLNTWSGVYYGNDKPHDGGFVVALKDTKATGTADSSVRFGQIFADGGHGGTGIALYKDWLYAETNDKIVRYDVKSGPPTADAKAETVLSGMPINGDHPMHPFNIDAQGNLFVSMGSATNACEIKNRMPHSPGNDPCVELETRAGIWRYDANKTGQVFSAGQRYASGNRNAEGFDFDTAMNLLDEEYILDIIEMKNFSGKSRNRMIELKGRVIGTKGRSKKMIEDATETKISIYGKTICIIGRWDRIVHARKSIEMLLNGSLHNTVYRFLAKVKR
jgi:hypothetical protein